MIDKMLSYAFTKFAFGFVTGAVFMFVAIVIFLIKISKNKEKSENTFQEDIDNYNKDVDLSKVSTHPEAPVFKSAEGSMVHSLIAYDEFKKLLANEPWNIHKLHDDYFDYGEPTQYGYLKVGFRNPKEANSYRLWHDNMHSRYMDYGFNPEYEFHSTASTVITDYVGVSADHIVSISEFTKIVKNIKSVRKNPDEVNIAYMPVRAVIDNELYGFYTLDDVQAYHKQYGKFVGQTIPNSIS